MTTYNAAALFDSVISFKKGITLQQGRALRDNPKAMAEGATNAPYVENNWHPYNSVAVGDAFDGLIYDVAVSGSAATITSPDFVDGYEYRFRCENLRHGSGSLIDLQINPYRETAAAYAGVVAIATGMNATTPVNGHVICHGARRSLAAHVIEPMFAVSGTVGVGSAQHAPVYVTHSPNQKLLRVQFSISGGIASFSTGKIFMYRRRAF